MKLERLFFLLILLSFTLFFSFSQAQTKKTYQLQLDYPDFGEIDFYMNFVSSTDSTFYAYTNPKTIYQNIPFYKKWYLQLFGEGKKPGAVLQIIEGKRDKNNYNGKIVSYMGDFYFKGTLVDDKIKGELIQDQKNLPFTGVEVEDKKRINNYDELNKTFQNTIAQNIYDPSVLKRKDWKKFLKKINKSLLKAEDDLDILISFFSSKQTLKTSHVYLTKKNITEDFTQKDSVINIEFNKIDKDIDELKIKSFSLADTTIINEKIKNLQADNLIIDLRNNSGGDFSSLLFASHFIDKPYKAGYFLGEKYYEKENQQHPSQKYLEQQKPFVNGSIDDFYRIIEKKGILVGQVNPSSIQYHGEIYVLIDNNTASAAEPLAYFLKDKNIGLLIGENTAGAMLSAKGFNIYKNWWLTLPVANYYTMDNKSLDQVGVKPDLEIDSDKAKDKAVELIKDNN